MTNKAPRVDERSMGGVILMVEDNPDDAWLVQRLLTRSGLKHDLRILQTGREAIDYLSGRGRYADRRSFPNPCLIILDLSIPGINGFGLIEWVRRNGETREVPIIVYSGSVSPEDAQRAYALGANAYFAKLSGPGHYLRRSTNFVRSSVNPPRDADRIPRIRLRRAE